MEFCNEPYEIIIKERKRDMNILKGSPIYSRIFDTDMRMSINYEKKVPLEVIKDQQVRC